MELYRAILKRRSIRNFQKRKIDIRELRRMVNCARLAPSAANMQPLEFLVITTQTLCSEIFKHLKWAGYIAPRGSPQAGCEPVAYIIILINKQKVAHSVVKRDEAAIRYSFKPDLRDVGAAAENIMLYAQSKGIASCWLGAINKQGIRKPLSMPKNLEVDSVIALGYPKMRSMVAKFTGPVNYYLDKRGILHVPKRPLRDVIHINRI
ncbi:MAG: nitroreductase family protein [Candidatus Omnitrophica bacterium]|nr:nitroreductase family protein [Candidatus Omnitrophota bacterium]